MSLELCVCVFCKQSVPMDGDSSVVYGTKQVYEDGDVRVAGHKKGDTASVKASLYGFSHNPCPSYSEDVRTLIRNRIALDGMTAKTAPLNATALEDMLLVYEWSEADYIRLAELHAIITTGRTISAPN